MGVRPATLRFSVRFPLRPRRRSTPDANSIYDAAGLRVVQNVNDVWRFLIYDIGGKLVAEYGGLQPTDEGGVK